MATREREFVSREDFTANMSDYFDRACSGVEVLISLAGMSGDYISYPTITHAKLRLHRTNDNITEGGAGNLENFLAHVKTLLPQSTETSQILDAVADFKSSQIAQ